MGADRGLLDDPHSLWNYGTLLPHRETALPSRTPLVPAPRISAALDIDVHLKLETANPTHSFKDRMAASAVAAAQGFGIETLFCASTGNLGAAIAAGCAAAGLEAVILNPADADEPMLPSATYGATVFSVRGTLEDCRRSWNVTSSTSSRGGSSKAICTRSRSRGSRRSRTKSRSS